MTISASLVMELRASTGAGMMDCKKALEEVDGDLNAAKDYLRKKGISIAAKKASRETNEGGIGLVTSGDGKTGAMVQLACETDFVARNDQFADLLERLAAQALAGGGDDLGGQTLADGGGTVDALITESISKMGENLQLVEATRLSVSGEGVVGGYVHSNKKIGVLVAVGAAGQMDAARGGELARDLAMHIAASQVSAISGDDMDPQVVEKEKEILVAQAKDSGKPDDIIEKMVQGRLNKFVKEVTLLEQSFVKDPDKTVKQLLAETGKEMGTELKVESFTKFQF